MTIPYLKSSELIDLLKLNGYEVVSDEFWEKHNRIIFKKDGETFPLQYEDVYYYPFVIKICSMLGIESPDECKKCHEQWLSQKNK
jgi:hypothetical protein